MGTYQGDNNAYGLYGFKDGANIFKLNNDGEFFVGKEKSDAKGNDIGTYLKFNYSTSEFKLRVDNFDLNATNLKLTSNLSDENHNKIGNWTLTPTKLYYPKTKDNYGTGIASKAGRDYVAFWAGYEGTKSEPFAQYDEEKNTNWQNATNFYVLNNGTMKATNCILSGKFEKKDTNNNVVRVGDYGGILVFSSTFENTNNSSTINFETIKSKEKKYSLTMGISTN
jgi:hypothetical protein